MAIVQYLRLRKYSPRVSQGLILGFDHHFNTLRFTIIIYFLYSDTFSNSAQIEVQNRAKDSGPLTKFMMAVKSFLLNVYFSLYLILMFKFTRSSIVCKY